jgi:signal transduction histidine kinase
MLTRILNLVNDSAYIITKDFQLIYSNNKTIQPEKSGSNICFEIIFNFTKPCHFCNINFSTVSSQTRSFPHIVQLTNQTYNNLPGENLILTQTDIEFENESAFIDLIHHPCQSPGDLNANDQLTTLGAHVQTIAHELSNPLTGLNLTYQKISEITSNNFDVKTSQIKPLLDLLSNDIQRASEIVSEIRNYSKPIARPIKIIDLKTVIKNGLRNVQRLYTNQVVNIDFKWNIPDRVKIYGHAGKLEQCFINIFKNCFDMFQIREKKTDAKIIISTEYHNSEKKICIHIIDNAGGISNDALKKVFKPYFTTKERYRGLGLGLYITSKILKEHGGSIQMDSSGDKTNVTVIMQIPD